MKKKLDDYIFIPLIVGIFFFHSFHIYAQDEKRVTLNLKKATFKEFTQNIENQTDYTFYYNALQTDSLLVTITAQNQNVQYILNQVLANSRFNYSIDKEQHIFVTHGRSIKTLLPFDFFQKEKVKNRETEKVKEETEIVVDYFEGRIKGINAEQKVYEIGIKSNTISKGNATITGRIVDLQTGSPIGGASVYLKKI